jgi:hypothetical protein
MSDNADIHGKTGLGKFTNPSVRSSSFYMKLVEQQELGFCKIAVPWPFQ